MSDEKQKVNLEMDPETWKAIQYSKKFDRIESASVDELYPSAPPPEEPPADPLRITTGDHEALERSRTFMGSLDGLTELQQVQIGMIRPDVFVERQQAQATEVETMPLEQAIGLLHFRKSQEWQQISELIALEYQTLNATAEDPTNVVANNFAQRATAIRNVLKKIGGLFRDAERRIEACTPKELHDAVPKDLQPIALRNAKSAEPPTE